MVYLRTTQRDYAVKHAERIPQLAADLRERLAARVGWSGVEPARKEVEKKAGESLHELLCDDPNEPDPVPALAHSGLIEIEIGEEEGPFWSLPWEFFLAAATTPHRNRSQRVVVIRHLAYRSPDIPPARHYEGLPHRLLIVKSNPDYLGNLYTDNSLEREGQNV